MSTAVQDQLDVDGSGEVTAAVAADWRPSRVEARAAIREAIHAAAAEHRGLVHIADVRKRLPKTVPPALIGAFTNRLVRRGYLVPTGRTRPNGDPSRKARNATKPTPVRRLVRPIPPEEAS